METRKAATMDLKGKEYAQVKDRLKEFRKDNPRGDIKTTPSIREDGTIMFEAVIVKDRADENSARATGHAYGPNKGDKAFEKVETIAVGRALAYIGYAADGEIASSEEMEEYETYKEQKHRETVLALQERLDSATSLKELGEVWAGLTGEMKVELLSYKNELKKKYENA